MNEKIHYVICYIERDNDIAEGEEIRFLNFDSLDDCIKAINQKVSTKKDIKVLEIKSVKDKIEVIQNIVRIEKTIIYDSKIQKDNRILALTNLD